MWGTLFLLFIGYIIYRLIKPKPTNQNRQNNGFISSEQSAIADRLEWYASQPAYKKEAKTYLAIAQAIREGRNPYPVDATNPSLPSSMVQEAATSTVSASAPTASSPQSEKKSINPFELLENINILLFAGAFLVVISIVIFVGANYDAVSDGIKMLLVALFTLALYISGLWLYQKPKLRPAGVTFTSIGMVMVPLLGVAYRNFVAPNGDATLLWFVVSVIAVVAYVATASIVRHWALMYTVILAVLSSQTSGLLALDAPVYVTAWVAVIAAGAMLLLAKDNDESQNIDSHNALKTMSSVIVPIALIVSLLNAIDHGVLQLAITAILIGTYYLEVSILSKDLEFSTNTLSAAIGLMAFGEILLFSYFGASRELVAALLLGIILVLIFVLAIHLNEWITKRSKAIEHVSLIAVVAAVLIWPFNEGWWLGVVSAGATMSVGYLLTKRLSFLWAALLALLTTPMAVSFMAYQAPDKEQSLTAVIAYLAIGLLFVALRFSLPRTRAAKSIQNNIEHLVLVGLSVSFVLALLASLLGSGLTIFTTFVIVGLVAMIFSYVEKNRQLQMLGHAIMLIPVFILSSVFELDVSVQLIVFIYGLVVYAVGIGLSWFDRLSGEIWRVFGIGAAVFAVTSAIDALQVGSLYVVAAMIAYEGYARAKSDLFYEAGLVATFATHWLIAKSSVDEILVYSFLWTLFFGVCTYFKNLQGKRDEAHILVVLTLLALTGPLALQTLNDPGDLARALLLLVEAIILILVGMAIRMKIVWQWGLVILVLEVLYQSLDVIQAVPKQLISLIIGLAIIGFAIYFLQKRNEE